jgi:uncharacterized protein YeaO (DUF488 family)
MIKIKRAYDKPEKSDGHRILVDRLWPRGIKKEKLALEEWDRDLAPSNSLRKYFKHDPGRWEIFQNRYQEELQSREANEKLHHLADLSRRESVTLVYGAHDENHNQAVVLKQVIERL